MTLQKAEKEVPVEFENPPHVILGMAMKKTKRKPARKPKPDVSQTALSWIG
jgi:hypothetical protein